MLLNNFKVVNRIFIKYTLGFQLKKHKNIHYGFFTEFDKHQIITAVSFRMGGVSSYPYNSLNCGFHTGDNKSNVLKNRELFFNALNINYKDIVTLKQIHSNKVVIVRKKDKGRGALDYDDSFAHADGMVTEDAGVPLVIFTADCMSLFFFDTVKKIIGIAHSGWKGTYFNISKNIINTMLTFGATLKNIIVGLSPAIGECCYEIGEDLINKFNYNFIETKNKKYYLNLNKANKMNLINSGINEKNIIESNFCTFCHKECFSYRREKITGRMASVIMKWE